VSIETKDSRTDAPAAETSHRSRRRSARRVDALAVATMAAALVVYLLHGFDGPLARDLAIYSYAGQRFAEGVAPYVGILNRAGPLAHMLPGIGVLGARAVDISDVTGMRVLFMIFSIACVGTCYVVARNVLSSRRAGVVAAFALLAFYGFVTYATGGPREKTPMVLFLLLTLWLWAGSAGRPRAWPWLSRRSRGSPCSLPGSRRRRRRSSGWAHGSGGARWAASPSARWSRRERSPSTSRPSVRSPSSSTASL
jgi:hypothetical protein